MRRINIRERSWKELASDCLLLVFVFGTIGIALKFTTFFDRWVYFPSFPNLLDATFLIFSVTYLAYKIKKR
jgi:cytochrome c oxidase assembly factor CtaG